MDDATVPLRSGGTQRERPLWALPFASVHSANSVQSRTGSLCVVHPRHRQRDRKHRSEHAAQLAANARGFRSAEDESGGAFEVQRERLISECKRTGRLLLIDGEDSGLLPVILAST